MKKSEIKIGGHYRAKVSGRLVTVRIDAIREVTVPVPRRYAASATAEKLQTRYDVTNLDTGRKLTFQSAMRFHSVAMKPQETNVEEITGRVLAGETGLTVEEVSKEEGEKRSDFMRTTEGSVQFVVDHTTDITAREDILEGEQCSDPQTADMASCAITSLQHHVTGVEQESCTAKDTKTTVKQELVGLASKIASIQKRQTREVGTLVAGMVPNEEQEAILAAAVEPGLKVLVVAAGAGCLAGDTIIHVNRAGKSFAISIRDLAERQTGAQPVITRTYLMKGTPVTSTQRNHAWDMNIPTMIARAENESIRLCKLKEVWYSGEKETFSLTTSTGRSIRATAIHPFLMDNGGWLKLSEIKVGDFVQINSGRGSSGRGKKLNYKYSDTKFHPNQTCRSLSKDRPTPRYGVPTHRLIWEANLNKLTLSTYLWILRHDYIKASALSYLSQNEIVHHINGDTKDNNLSNLELVNNQKEHSDKHDWHKNVLWKVGFEEVISIEPYGMEPTYDIEVEDEPHNFVANGFIVHNTGKTATLKMLEQVLPGKIQYTAFNSALVAEGKTKFTKADCNTTHSLAFRAVGHKYKHRLGGERIKSYQVARMLGIEPLNIILNGMGTPDAEGKPTDKLKVLQPDFLAGQVTVAIRKFCQSADREIGAHHFNRIDGIDAVVDGKRISDNNAIVREYLVPIARKAWKDINRVDGQLPFTHDCYVKIWQLGEGDDRPVIAANYILLDEAQDTAPVFLDILKQQTHATLILVGDDCQQIYEWRGACNAMKAFEGAPRLMLSQSYRFGQAVADVANAVLATLEEPTDLVMRGLSTIPSRVDVVSNPRCYLYRTNAGAVSRVMLEFAAKKRPHLIGGSDEVVRWCEAAIDLQAKRGTRHPELCCFETWDEVVEYSKTDEGADMALMVKLVEKFGAANIKNALKDMPDEKDADLIVSTAHRSKGREWNTVRLGQDFPTANKMGDPDRRLLYVAGTRAKMTLDISECPPFCGGTEGKGEESRWIPGIEINYTQPMPSALAESEQQHSEPTPTTNTTSEKKNGNGIPTDVFTWAKGYNGKWNLRGPKDAKPGDSVRVVKKNGAISYETVKEVLKRYDDVWIYGV